MLALEQEVCPGCGTSSAASTRRAEAISAKVFLEQLRNLFIMSQQVLPVRTMNNIVSVDFALPEIANNINCDNYMIGLAVLNSMFSISRSAVA